MIQGLAESVRQQSARHLPGAGRTDGERGAHPRRRGRHVERTGKNAPDRLCVTRNDKVVQRWRQWFHIKIKEKNIVQI